MTNFSNIIDIHILDIDDKSGAELVAWDETGTIYIFENSKTEPYWEHDVGGHIGGVVFGDIKAKSNNIFENFDGVEMVVSVDGKVYIYYSESDDDFLNERYVLTDEVGRLNRDATGLVLVDLYDDDELDVIVGHEKGFKDYHYIPPTYSDVPCFMALIISVLLTLFLLYYPEWYLVDVVGIIVAAGVTALIGISIGLLPIIVLLMILALYDAISVYKTRHMVSLADKVMEFKLPILLVVPKKRGYSFLRQKGLRKQLEDGEEREAMFVGLGDIIIPGTLVISAFHFLPTTTGWFGMSANLLVAIFTLIGILVGFSALMHFVMKGNPQAGLPLLNTGAILGFFISNFMLYQDITFGLALPFG
jgi:presenilin-like A22 family membrane protease